MEDRVCIERHKRVNERLDTHERRINNHSERIDRLEQYQSRTEAKIENLCEQIKSLVQTIKWSMTLAVTTLLGFFIWYIQNL